MLITSCETKSHYMPGWQCSTPLITHLCLYSELNDLKNCRLKWKGERGGGRRIRKERGSGMHLELRNLNFPAHLKLESHGRCRTRCSSGVNRHGSLIIRELC